ncbi:MAG: hypothetical protein KAQ81_03775, partial [Deltaproteobacteria bacterium]|nr:hypothetical protein [Deltaproteobacteria bacterium]
MFHLSLRVTFLLIILVSFSAPSHDVGALTLSELDVNFELILEDNTTMIGNIENFKSSLTILEFFDVGCGACTDQVPHLDELRAHFSSYELTLISLALHPESHSVDSVIDYRDDKGITWLFGRDINDLWEDFGVEYIPAFLWFHTNGTILYGMDEGFQSSS